MTDTAKPEQDTLLISRQDAADLLGVSTKTLQKWIASGQLRTMPESKFLSRDAVLRFAQQREGDSYV